MTRHRIGGARTIKTAVLVCEYLRARCASPHSTIPKDTIRYAFHEPSGNNGYWSADIIVETYNDDYDPKQEKAINNMVDICRAFVAGAGEVWA